MIVLDVNLLICAYDTTCKEHKKARVWVEDVFIGDEPVGLPWQTLSAFLRILTYPETFGERFSMKRAAGIVCEWLALPHARMLVPGEGHWRLFQEMLAKGDVRGKLTSGAALAALTVEYGGVLYTNDGDFAGFQDCGGSSPL
ncbi:MAG: TA system VapC family ribonuclease toxin [Terracidiphilus sp.]|jgi:toxin-antitoxin system PIN domain toxin